MYVSHQLDVHDTDDSLLDLRGNRNLIIICCINIGVLYPGTKLYYMWRNRQRAKVWDAMTSEVCLNPILQHRQITD